MKQRLTIIVGAILAMVLFSRLAVAQTPAPPVNNRPLLSVSRLSLAAGGQYAWRTTPLANNSEPLCGRHAEWEAGLFGAYNLTPHGSLVGSTTLGIDSRQFRHTLGFRIRLWVGK